MWWCKYLYDERMRYRDYYTDCRLCGRNCGSNRFSGGRGVCGEGARMRLAAALVHFGEEPVLCGEGGSGTLFFTGCSLKCPYCQNMQISGGDVGAEIDEKELVDIVFALEAEGVSNINVVTGTHFAPSIVHALTEARRQGLRLPVVWNTSSYESKQCLELIDEVADVYLADLKTLDVELAAALFHDPGYPRKAEQAIRLMLAGKQLRYKGSLVVEGVIIRHLILPGMIEASVPVLEWFAGNAQSDAILSLLVQYYPIMNPALMTLQTEFPNFEPGRCVDASEYDLLIDHLDRLHIDDGFIQELTHNASQEKGEYGTTTDTSWLPDFTQRSPFRSLRAKTVWSCICEN